jgi:photosystem II stability/assembly factor-like uncharacterized protein
VNSRSGRGIVIFAALFAASATRLLAGHYSWTTAGPEPGMVFQIVAYGPNPNRLYIVGSYFGGYLFRTDDRGQNWCYVETLPALSFVVADQNHPDVLYAPSYPSVVKTTNGGVSWQPAGAGLPSGYINAMAMAPSAPDTLYAISGQTPHGLYRSDDAAESWSRVSGDSFPGTNFWSLSVDAFDPDRLYLLTGNEFWKSSDGGATWNTAGEGLPPYVQRVFSDPRTPGMIWAAMNDAGVYKSVDEGVTFSPSNAGIADRHVRDMSFDRIDPLTSYAAAMGGTDPGIFGGLFVSHDGGASWSPIDIGFAGAHFASAVAVDPGSASRLYVGGGTSVLRGNFLESADAGGTWTHAEKGLSGYYARTVAAHPDIPDAAYGFSFTNFFGTPDGGATWSLVDSTRFAVQSLLFDPTDSSILYGQYNGWIEPTYYGGVYKSVDGGASWRDASAGLSTSTAGALAIGVSDPATLLSSNYDGVFKTSDAGATWANVLPGLGRAVAVDPADPQILYASRHYSAGQDPFLRSADGGATWLPPAGFTSTQSPLDLAVQPSDADIVYALLNNAVYKSTDRGLSFAPSSAGLEGMEYPSLIRISLDPRNEATLYVASELAGVVFRTTDAAASWRPLGGFVPRF